MKRVLRAVLIVLPLVCGASASADPHGGHAHMHHDSLTPTAPSNSSVYSLDSVWSADDGREIQLQELRGKATVIAMFYGTCTAACPILVDLMKRGELALTQSERDNTTFVLVTFDPARDSAAALKAYREKRELGSSRWVLLRGADDDTLELSVLLGVKFKSNEDGSFSHSNVITVLNPKGEIIGQHLGLQAGGEKIEDLVRKALEVSSER